MSLTVTGSVRVDLLGGTLDLNPINVVLPRVITLNLATTLKAKATLEALDRPGIEVHSLDYKTTHFYPFAELSEAQLRSGLFGPLTFVMWICYELGVDQGLRLTLESGSPPGSGLGGSSAMGVTLAQGILAWQKRELKSGAEHIQLIRKIQSIESLILDAGPAGYQDYFPALFGGILALKASFGDVTVEQCYSPELAQILETHLTLIHSGEARNSGINNWEVYKGFFDREKPIRKGLQEIAKLSSEAYDCLKAGQHQRLVELIALEGEHRKHLFPGIVSSSMNSLYKKLKEVIPHLGMKVCGAGGGGAFLLVHRPEDRPEILDQLSRSQMKQLDFQVDGPRLGDYGA